MVLANGKKKGEGESEHTTHTGLLHSDGEAAHVGG
jgi:hypothetical protein